MVRHVLPNVTGPVFVIATINLALAIITEATLKLIPLPETTRIRVWDSTAETRYLVVPMRPEGTEGLGEEALADLVTRDSMIGTGLPLRPEQVVR